MRNNHFLALLGVVQTALILFLLIRVINLEDRPIEPASGRQDTASMEQPAPPRNLGRPIENHPPLDEARLRQIVREELRAQLDETLASTAQGEEQESPDPVSAAEYQYRLDAAMQNLDYHIQQGEISNADMIKLQSEIALLDKEGRTQMLSRLARAMSTGELKGQF